MRKTAGLLANLKQRHFYFALFWMLCTVPFLATLRAAGALSLRDENYSHILIVPFVSIFLIFLERKNIFQNCSFSAWTGLVLIVLAAMLYFTLARSVPSSVIDGRFSIAVFAVILIWAGSFVLFYGTKAASAAKFSLLFLLLMIPIPTSFLTKMIASLQHGSADVTHIFLKLSGIPVFRQDTVFSLPGIKIQVAEACSGIHSSLALLIVGILAGHLCLEATWRKVFLTLLTIPISIVKNALRIAVISGLGIYVDRGFFYGTLHRYSGYPFALVALLMLGPAFLALRRSETASTMRRADRLPGYSD